MSGDLHEWANGPREAPDMLMWESLLGWINLLVPRCQSEMFGASILPIQKK